MSSTPAADQPRRISAEELKRRFDCGDPLVLLDVREDDERAAAAIRAPSSIRDVLVPMGLIPGRLEQIREWARSLPLVVYCHHGVRSRAAADWLERQGLERVVDLEGGIDAWSRRVDSTVPRY